MSSQTASRHICQTWDEHIRDLPAELREWMTQPECPECVAEDAFIARCESLPDYCPDCVAEAGEEIPPFLLEWEDDGNDNVVATCGACDGRWVNRPGETGIDAI